MPLPGGGDVEINGIPFQIYANTDLPFPYYEHSLEPITVGRQDITGKPGRQNIRPDLVMWAFDDWSGGEGNKIFDPDNPTKYNAGHGNPRNPGYLTARPIKSESTQTVTGAGTATVQGNTLVFHAGTPLGDSDDMRLPEQTDEVKWTGRTPGATPVAVQFNLKPMSYRAESFNGSAFSLQAGSPTVSGTYYDLNNPGDQVRLSTREVGRNTSVKLTIGLYDGTIDRFGRSSQTYTVRAIRTDTLATIVSATGTLPAGGTAAPVLEFSAPSRNYHIQVEFTSSTAGADPKITLLWCFEEWRDGTTTAVVRVRNTTDGVDISTTYNGTAATTHTITVPGPLTATLTFTGVAGKTYEYRAQNNSANHDTLMVDYLAESTVTNFLGDVDIVETRSRIWVGFGANVLSSTDGITWENRALSTAPGAGMRIVSLAADDDYVYALLHDNPSPGVNGNVEIQRITPVLSGADWTSARMFGPAAGAPYPTRLAMAPAVRRLYRVDGPALYEFDVTQAAPWTQNSVHSISGTTPTPVGRHLDLVTIDDNSVCYMVSAAGRTTVYQFKNGAGRTLWFGPGDFTGRALAYNQGVLLIAGGDSVGLAPGIKLYAINMRSEQSVYLGKFHELDTIIPTSSQAASGSSFILGCNLGHAFIYDTEKEAFSLLDNPGGGIVAGVGTFLGYNIIAIALNVSQVKMITYRPDSTPGEGTFENTSSAWDFDFPEVQKILQGFNVVTEPLAEGQTIEVFYRIDQAGDYVSVGTIDTAGATRQFVPAPSSPNTVTFNSLEVKVHGNQDTAQTAPKLLSWTAYTSLREKVETWDLALRVYHEDVDRPDTESRRGEEIRDALLAIAEAGQIVTFKDGYRREREGFTTHSVLLEEPHDIVQKTGESFMRVRLRKADV